MTRPARSSFPGIRWAARVRRFAFRILLATGWASAAAVSAAPPPPETLSAADRAALEKANIRVERGNAFALEGRFRKAEQEYRAAVRTFPRHVDALYNLAVVYRRMKRPKKAEETYRRLLQVDPDSPDALTDLGDLLDDRGEREEAEKLYRRAVEVSPGFGRAWNNLGFLLQKEGRLEEAAEAFRQYVRIQERRGAPTAWGWYNLGCSLLELGRVRDAKQALLKAAERLPDDYLVNNALGNVYVVQGLPTQALLRFRRAQKANPKYAPVYEGLGDVYAARGETGKALEMYEEAVRLRPDYAAVHLKLGRLLRDSDPAKAKLHFQAYLRYGKRPEFLKEAKEACGLPSGEGK